MQRQSEAAKALFAWLGIVSRFGARLCEPQQLDFGRDRGEILCVSRARGRCGSQTLGPSRGFTLVELILVMALLVIGVSFVTPRMQVFFRGRTLTSEARQMVALMHNGQSRAVSGGVPMTLWFDSDKKKYGIEEEPGYSDKDPKAEEFDLNENLKIEIPEGDPSVSQPGTSDVNSAHAGLPKITFLPDGSIADTSPKSVRIVDNDGSVLLLKQSRDRTFYEITTTTEQQ
jgi:prepilin-type N-terminal cleavage/methylation domain-containing protein